MKNNIGPIIDNHYREIERRISKLNWNHEGNFYSDPDTDLCLQFRHPTILWHEDGQGGSGGYLWYQLSVESKIYPEKVLKNVLKKLLEIIELNAFMDEDAGGKFFAEKVEHISGYIRVYCYINPDFPKGWWQNHALPEGHK